MSTKIHLLKNIDFDRRRLERSYGKNKINNFFTNAYKL